MRFDSSGVRGLPEVVAAMKEFSERRLNAALATALTRTAVQVRESVKAGMLQAFDKPTPYTMGQVKYVGATADKLMSVVGFGVVAIQDVYGRVVRYQDIGRSNTPAGNYLQPHIDASKRHTKRYEVALQAIGALPAGWATVPGAGASLDGYGNVKVGQIIQILSQLRITMTAGHDRNMSFDARKQINAQRKAGGRFFVVAPGGKGGMQPGIYQREFFGRNVTPVLVFVPKVSYSKRFDFYGLGDRVAAERLPINVRQAVHEQRERLNLKRTG